MNKLVFALLVSLPLVAFGVEEDVYTPLMLNTERPGSLIEKRGACLALYTHLGSSYQATGMERPKPGAAIYSTIGKQGLFVDLEAEIVSTSEYMRGYGEMDRFLNEMKAEGEDAYNEEGSIERNKCQMHENATGKVVTGWVRANTTEGDERYERYRAFVEKSHANTLSVQKERIMEVFELMSE